MTLLYIGTQTSGPGAGIHAARLDEDSGTLTLLGLAAEVERPTWLLADPQRPILYAVSEVGNAGDRPGAVLACALADDAESLHPLGIVSAAGGGTTHLALSRDGGTLFAANFGGGQAVAIPVRADGTLGPVASEAAGYGSGPHRRQPGPRPHGVTLSPSGRELLVPDMGADRIFIHRLDARDGALTPAAVPFVDLPAGSGPRLLLFGGDGRFAYLLTELSAELFTFRWDAESALLVEIGRSPLDAPGAEHAPSAAGLCLSADGRFLYASNRGTAAIHAFALDPATGLPEAVQIIASGGAKPWCLAIAPSGRWLVSANQASDGVQIFAIVDDGRLSVAGAPLPVNSPTGLAFMPARMG